MNSLEVTCRIDTQKWVQAQGILMSHTKTKTSQGLARAVAFVVKDAKLESIKRNVPISRIDADLDRPVTTSRGKALNGKTTLTYGMAVVLARANPNSRYSKMTDNRWPVVFGAKPSDFAMPKDYRHGIPNGNPWVLFLDAIVKPMVERMRSARHSSSGFLAITWNPVLDAISTYVDDKYKAAVGAWSGYSAKKKLLFGVGDARMVGEGTQKCTLTVFNQLGMSSLYPNLDKERNAAVHRILGPILQASIDKNFKRQCQVAWDKYGIDLESKLKSLGFRLGFR
jgi:hypothetical protein